MTSRPCVGFVWHIVKKCTSYTFVRTGVGMKPVGHRRVPSGTDGLRRVPTGPRLAVFHNITMYILIREYRRAPVWRRRAIFHNITMYKSTFICHLSEGPDGICISQWLRGTGYYKDEIIVYLFLLLKNGQVNIDTYFFEVPCLGLFTNQIVFK